MISRLDDCYRRCDSRAPIWGHKIPMFWGWDVVMGLLSQVFTWWNGDTPWTRYFTWRHGKQIGTDRFGNRYFEEKNGPRRWVIYSGEAEASSVPPLWNGWLHHTIDSAPLEEPPAHDWEKEHLPNLTGTAAAYRPPGDITGRGQRARATGDYEPWQPS